MNDAGSKSKHLAQVLTPISVNCPFSERAKDEPSSILHGACSGLLTPPKKKFDKKFSRFKKSALIYQLRRIQFQMDWNFLNKLHCW